MDGDKPWHVAVQVYRSSKLHRTTGHAAEMAFFAVLTLVPSTVAVGSALALSERLVGAGVSAEAEGAAVKAVRVLMGPELTDRVIAPFIHTQLSQPRGGVAIGGLIVAWWLSSHLFMATAYALDYCYGAHHSRPTVIQRFIALAFALGSVGVVSLTVELMVSGPLGNPSGGIANRLGVGDVYAFTWSVLRWPLLLLVVVGFLLCLYRFSPNVKHSFRHCLPGAVAGAFLWIFAAFLFRITADLRDLSGVVADDPTVALIGQAVNAVIATVLWAYLASIAILLGGEVNAVTRARRVAAGEEPAAPAKEPAPDEPPGPAPGPPPAEAERPSPALNR
jgi:membrane protein